MQFSVWTGRAVDAILVFGGGCDPGELVVCSFCDGAIWVCHLRRAAQAVIAVLRDELRAGRAGGLRRIRFISPVGWIFLECKIIRYERLAPVADGLEAAVAIEAKRLSTGIFAVGSVRQHYADTFTGWYVLIGWPL